MKTLSERMNTVEGTQQGAYIIRGLSTGTGSIDLVDTFCLICSEQGVPVSALDDDEFWVAHEQFCDYVKGAQKRGVDILSIWFAE